MITGFSKRITLLVDDAEAASAFYRRIFGWSVWYDNVLPVDHRFPPCAPDGTEARLIMLKAHDPRIGMIGFLQFIGFEPEADPGHRRRERVRLGDTILVMEAQDLDATCRLAETAGARIVSPPTHWTVPGPAGDEIRLYAMSMFDPWGYYSEISQSRG